MNPFLSRSLSTRPAMTPLRRKKPLLALFITLFAFTHGLAQTASLDVLFVYTSAVKSAYGDHDGVLAKAQEIIAKGNLGFSNSDIDATFNLAHLHEVAYVESNSFFDDLYALSDEDGAMDEVFTLRDEWGADLVCLLRSGSEGGTAGLGWILNSETGRQYNSFSVASIQSSVSSNTFTHEIGHNLGAAHDVDNADVDDGLFPYSYGYRFTATNNQKYRTIMAYSDGDSQINYFSNPLVSYQGTPTGVSNSTDNAKTLNATVGITAAYEVHQTPIPSFPITFPGLAFVEGQSKIVVSNAVGTPDLSFQWYEGISGDVSSPISGATSTDYTTPILNSSANYWLRATNPNGSGDSPTYTLTTTSPPSQNNTTDLNHNPANSGFLIFRTNNGPVWQEFIPSKSYLHEIEVNLWKKGAAGRLKVDVTDENGVVIYRRIYAEDDLESQDNRFSNDPWLTLPIKTYINEGTLHRITFEILDGDVSDTHFALQVTTGSNDSYPDGASSRDDGSTKYDYYFRTKGSNASVPTASINLDENSLDGEATSYNIAVTSSGAWTADEALDWVTLSPANGNGNGTVTVTLLRNDSGSERNGNILIGGNNHAITQAAFVFITTINPTSRDVDGEATNYDIAISSNGAWTAEESLDWISLNSTSGSGNGTMTVTLSRNESGSARNGSIAIGGNNHTITQAAFIATTTINPTSNSLNGDHANYDISVTSDGSWIASESLDWVSISPTNGTNNGTVSVTITENLTGSERSGSITIGGNSHTLTQAPTPFSGSFNTQESTANHNGGNASITLTTNHAWTLESDSWIIIQSAISGTGSTTINYEIAPNDLQTPRIGSIRIANEISHTILQFPEIITFDEWIRDYYSDSDLQAMSPNAMEADSDRDGLNNNGEYLLQLDPSDSQSKPELTFNRSNDTTTLQVTPVVIGITYILNSSTNLINWESILQTTIVNDAPIIFTLPDDDAYYQLQVSPSP